MSARKPLGVIYHMHPNSFANLASDPGARIGVPILDLAGIRVGGLPETGGPPTRLLLPRGRCTAGVSLNWHESGGCSDWGQPVRGMPVLRGAVLGAKRIADWASKQGVNRWPMSMAGTQAGYISN